MIALLAAACKLYARHVRPSRSITLDGIGEGPRRPYLDRWHLLPRNPWFNVYLHRFLASDDERALHDHPWASASLILEGTYIEHTSEFMPETPVGDVSAHTEQAYRLFTINDGRNYVSGSVHRNAGRHVGLQRFDYVQVFSTGSFRRMPAEHMHRLELASPECWTLFFTGPRVRRWGFLCPSGWRDAELFTAQRSSAANQTIGCD